ncbi:phosphoenolpyruvate--protein phosphotransferase [Thermogemmatispora tikiterensis]|uniref:Multiphosphoryl transfer protein n=1 Tax=Thermogemmatispora tikiterensis TaxID=1825093 RepID=A0A328VGN1_9CHLR|nr:phosphoenolpyruvate--protein phosphotransferase [Thermogemmatispora tikiterensis]RAQ94900.1 phosphoenolpyruvate--protein phosphotransferase [Thermogemmatispora tikiterensis]
MIRITEQQVRLQAQAEDKQGAIRQAGDLLVRSGCIETGYIDSMLQREQVANTYLGNGIAIPHGLPRDQELIHRTGIAVLQLPAGVIWNPGEIVHLVVAIAARSDEHIDALRRLTRVLGDMAAVERLIHTTDPRDIIEALTGERPATPSAVADYTAFFEAVIQNRTGLHARPATRFVELARGFQAAIRVRYGERVADGKSLIALLQLGVERGATIRVSAEGPDAAQALATLQEAIAAGLGDELEPLPARDEKIPGAVPRWAPRSAAAIYSGLGASGGLAIAPLQRYRRERLEVADQPGNPASEGLALQHALDAAQAELDQLYEEVRARLGSSRAAIFRAHREFLQDAELIQEAVRLIYAGHGAAWAWQQAISRRVNQLQQLDDPVLAGRAVDLSDVGERVLRHLLGVSAPGAFPISGPVILVADDLTPSDTAALDPDIVQGLCTARGGPTSHTAIIARSQGIPAVVAAGEGVLALADGTPAILDGFNGRLYVKPSEADLAEARTLQVQLQQQEEAAQGQRFAPAVTRDGHHVEIAANINRAEEVPQALAAGAEGVGLMRTEFLFLGRAAPPSEDEQYAAYCAMARALNGRPLIIRTLDIGGDKQVPYLELSAEDSSFLGLRGIRLCLVYPDLFVTQLRALYRAAACGPISIMFPMIATLEDFAQAREYAERVRRELNAPRLPLGMMVEVPSAVLLAEEFAAEVDFFSIGTNDLTQYTLAMDRLHPQLARQADALHPAVLRMIARTVEAARAAGKWVGVCGGMASEPLGAALLVGLGVSELSMTIPSLATIKAQIRSRSLAELQQLAQRALRCRTAEEVRAL